MGRLGRKFLHKLPDMAILRNLESPFILWIQIDIYFLASTNYSPHQREQLHHLCKRRLSGPGDIPLLFAGVGRDVEEASVDPFGPAPFEMTGIGQRSEERSGGDLAEPGQIGDLGRRERPRARLHWRIIASRPSRVRREARRWESLSVECRRDGRLRGGWRALRAPV